MTNVLRTFALLAAVLSFGDLPPAAQRQFEKLGINDGAFPGLVRKIETETVARERDGENDHLIYFVLQSRAFTQAPPLEPAESARLFVDSGRVPNAVTHRFTRFLSARVKGERLSYFRSLVPATHSAEFLTLEYGRAMRSLYDKEFAKRPDFYQRRGHSTDTQVAANYAVFAALELLHATDSTLNFRRVLIVGPGLDFSPRTALDERFPPQSYQPYAVADALLSLHMASAASLEIRCVDINERVLQFFRDFPKRPHADIQLSSIPGDPDYLSYFKLLGSSIGEIRQSRPLNKTVTVRPEIVRSISAEKLNIVTSHPQGPFDLVIATNVFLYFDDPSLLLALTNISASMSSGGYLIHNEIRIALDDYAPAVGLVPVHARTLRIAAGTTAPLLDSFAVYRRAN